MKISTKKITRSLLIGFCAFVILSLPLAFTFAQEINYVPLAPLPGIGDTGPVTSLSSYLVSAFRLIIGLAALLAVVMITLGGIQYMSTDAISGKSEGKEKITNALIGLFLAIGSWLILYTVNPRTLDFNLNISPIQTVTTNPTNSGVMRKFIKERFCFPEGTTSIAEAHATQFTEFPYRVSSATEKNEARVACAQSFPANMSQGPATSNCPGASQEAVYCTDVEITANSSGPTIQHAWVKKLICHPTAGNTETTTEVSGGRFPYETGNANARTDAMDMCTAANPTVRSDTPPDHCGNTARSETIQCFDETI